MSGITWLTALTLLGGLLVHTLKDYGAARMNNVQLTLTQYLSGSWVEGVVATVAALVMWLSLPELAAAFPDLARTAGVGAKQTVLSSFIVGYMSNSLVGLLGNRAKLVAGVK